MVSPEGHVFGDMAASTVGLRREFHSGVANFCVIRNGNSESMLNRSAPRFNGFFLGSCYFPS